MPQRRMFSPKLQEVNCEPRSACRILAALSIRLTVAMLTALLTSTVSAVVGKRAGHDHPVEAVYDGAAVHLAVAGGALGDVCTPQFVGPGGGESPAHQVL